MLYPRGGTRGEVAGAVAEFFRQHRRADVDILQNARKAVRRALRIERDRHAVVMAGRKARRPLRVAQKRHGEVSRREKVMSALVLALHASLSAVVNGKHAVGGGDILPIPARVNVVVAQLNAGKDRVGCDVDDAVRPLRTADLRLHAGSNGPGSEKHF